MQSHILCTQNKKQLFSLESEGALEKKHCIKSSVKSGEQKKIMWKQLLKYDIIWAITYTLYI